MMTTYREFVTDLDWSLKDDRWMGYWFLTPMVTVWSVWNLYVTYLLTTGV